MSAKVVQLRNADEENVYPVTLASASYLDNAKQTVQSAIDDMQENDATIIFPALNTIKKTLASGNVVTTTFYVGKIKEVTTDPEGTTIKTRITTLNKDGSINIEIVGDK